MGDKNKSGIIGTNGVCG
jgi:hypothetical protein